MFRHPKDDDLRRFARQALDVPERARVARHLARCTRCRAEIARFRELRQTLAVATEPPDAPDVLERVLARREAGERVLLPDIVTTAPRPVHWRFAAAAAVVLMIASAAVTLISAPRVNAAASTLRFVPENPTPGATIRVIYEAGSLLAGEDTLVLRGRFRTEEDVPYNHGARQRTVTRLVRGAGGAFHGSFELPDSLMYAVFAVEDRAGSRIDHNRHALWELEVADTDGRPLIEALDQRFNDLHGRSWAGMIETVRRATRIHPEDPWGWTLLNSVLGRTLGPDARDSLSQVVSERGAELHESLVFRRDLSPRVIELMTRLAPTRDERRAWLDRLLDEHPTYHWSIFIEENRANPFADATDDRVDEYFRVVEDLWSRIEDVAGPSYHGLISNAVMRAYHSDRPEEFHRWSQRAFRFTHVEPPSIVYYVDRLARWPEHLATAEELTRQYLLEWSRYEDALRPLTATREEHARTADGWVRAGMAALGKMLVMKGDVSAGLAALESATRHGWETAVFREAAVGRGAAGDTVGMLREFARLAVDPAFESYADSARLLGGRHYDADAWAAWTADARNRMRAVTLRHTSIVPLRRGVRVQDAEGQLVRLAELIGDRVTVIAAWSPYCGFSLQELPEVERLNDWLRTRGANLVAITERESPDVTRALTESGVSFPTYYDKHNEAYDALVKFSEPAYWVVDASGRIMFSNVRLPDVRRQVAALLEERDRAE